MDCKYLLKLQRSQCAWPSLVSNGHLQCLCSCLLLGSLWTVSAASRSSPHKKSSRWVWTETSVATVFQIKPAAVQMAGTHNVDISKSVILPLQRRKSFWRMCWYVLTWNDATAGFPSHYLAGGNKLRSEQTNILGKILQLWEDRQRWFIIHWRALEWSAGWPCSYWSWIFRCWEY